MDDFGNNGRRLQDLDRRDRLIIKLLQEDGRRSTADIARIVGVSEPTAKKRIDRLIEEQIIKVVATVNPRKTPLQVDVIVGIKTEPGMMRHVGSVLSDAQEVVYLGYTTGRFDIIAELLFKTNDELIEFLDQGVKAIAGVVSTETFCVLRNEKINYDWKVPEEWLEITDQEE
jgi:Lrp/AsnC family transcriptional regulator for asnA, asnC and gidA